MKKLLTTVGIALVISASHAKADTSWFVYCEGVENGQTTAYLTNAIYTHYESNARKQELENAAVEKLAETRGAPLYGCSGVNFRSKASAAMAMEKTVEVHQRFGNKVVMFNMPAPASPRVVADTSLKRSRLSRGQIRPVNTTFATGPSER